MYKTKTGIIQKIRNSRTFKGMSATVLLTLLFETIQPTISLALTEGPSQPEVQSFEPINTTNMVDLFTGDFNYNIPLFNLPGPNGGYPVNLAYQAGTTMDDEASWVGLGWNINAGSLVRNVRGLPDEFMSKPADDDRTSASATSDYLEVQSDMKESWTLGLTTGFAPEIFGADLEAGKTSLALSASVYYNNYNGSGISVGPTLSVGMQNGAYNFGLSLDTENGMGVSASLDLRRVHNTTTYEHQMGITFDGSLSMDYNLSKVGWREGKSKDKDGGNVYVADKSSVAGSGMSFARGSFSPSLSGNIDRYNVAISFKTGLSLFGTYGAGSIGMFYNTQDYSKSDKKGRKRLVTGYTQSGNSTDVLTNSPHYLRDFSRENDGQITKGTMYLPNSQYTYDTYSSTGQGLIGYFRPRRSDVGRSFDPYIYNSSIGLSATIDLSTTHAGVGMGVNFGWDSQGAWNDLNALQFEFLNPDGEGINENLYYQVHGEQTILDKNEFNYMNGLDLAEVRLKTKDADNLSGGKRRLDADAVASYPNNKYAEKRSPSSRMVRNTMVHNLKNKEVGASGENLGEFNIKYFGNQSQVFGAASSSLNRTNRNGVNIENHPAGYKVLNQDGSYYVYGLPCYNNKEVENLFSTALPSNPSNTERVPSQTSFDYKINGTQKFIHKTTKSPYAHSYMLSSVLGNDYIDLTNNGPSDDDMGYWVKFNYVKRADNYKWRAPYADNQYSQGQIWTAEDDKASYQYGEKELWYLGQIETKTHIAVFEMQPRTDMMEAAKENGESGTSVLSGLKLARIHVYEKKSLQANVNAVPLQTVHFDYHTGVNELCRYTPNASNNGKLTLKSVHFTYNGSTRGTLNRYLFDYTSTNPINHDNPSYATNSYDSWGTYKPKGSKYEFHSHFPYVNQFNQDWNTDAWEPNYGTSVENDATKTITQETQDALASAWCLKKITLPSGGTINIQYESDDYGYVQHKTANQMFKIHKLGDEGLADDQIYKGDMGDHDFYDISSFADEKRRRIYFKLENPIPIASTTIASASKQVYDNYVIPIIQDESKQRNLYFKTKMRLTEGVYDYVSGYLPLEDVFDMGSGNYNFGVNPTYSSNGYYTHGFVTVKAALKRNGTYFDNYHPLALAGWVYLQTNAQTLLSNSSSTWEGQGMGSSPGVNDVISKMGALASMLPAAASSFGAIRAYCKAKNLANRINLNYSCIRLASPDKKKFGGGHRVKEISITDNWSSDTGGSESTHTYGQRFDYTMTENGKTISSGVAQYEPQAGGDENALKYPVFYFDKKSFFTKNNLFAEAPFNESLYPGASVGYSKVTVKSINTDRQLKNNVSGTSVGRTGGVSVHSFYTARDFPTMFKTSMLSEENSTKDVFNLPISIPLIGSIKRNYFHGTQAYLIELNDMHGKPKSVETFELNGYLVNPNPITSSSYDYQYDVITYQNETVKKLNNYVNVIANDGKHATTNDANKRMMGVETDFYTDQRESKTFNMSIGLDMNVDVPFFPFISVWPTINNTKSMFRTYVTNKVIRRTGILKATKIRDLQTVNESEILAYDEKSGIPLLTKMKNEFGDDFYNYNIPAYYIYDRMGHAYQNINYNFTTNIQSGDPSGATVTPYLEFDATGHFNNLVRGDELLITDAPVAGNKYKKVYFLGWKYAGGVTKAMLHSPFGNITVGNNFKLKVIRSGNRNQFGGTVANYLTKGKFEQLILTASPNPVVNNKQVDPSDAQIVTPEIAANTLLSATATVLRDDWAPSVQLSLENDFVTENPFLTGNSGIWRPVKSYTYVGPRKTSADMSDNTGGNPQLRNDGVFETPVKMFTWELGNIEDYISNWEWVSEVTRYSPDAYELENVNRLGVYSSALYGYDNSLSIGVAGNATYHEIGVADFETIAGGSDFMKIMGQTNLNFDNGHFSSRDGRITEQVNVKKATVSLGDIIVTLANNPGIPSSYFNSQYEGMMVGVSLTTRKNMLPGNKGLYFNAICSVKDAGTILLKPYLRRNSAEKVVDDNSVFHGKITFFIPKTHKRLHSNDVSYSSVKAHTGKKSMKVTDTTSFDQPKIKLKTGPGVKYVFSMWVSRDNENVITYEPNAVAGDELVQIGKMSGFNMVALTNTPIIKYGKIVEGWQKVDVEFIWDDPNDIPCVHIIPGMSALYVDDVRISAKAGGISTYVYEPVKYRLSASLNIDNYATFYHYDEEGTLNLTKQETEKGIFTITESRGHVSK